MDPFAIVGAIGAILGTIDVINKSISAVTGLRQEWKEADITFLSLTTQLTAIRGALDKIAKWVSTDFYEESHHQLVMDLETSVCHCKMLVDKVHTFLAELVESSGTPLDIKSKIKLVFGNANIEVIEKLLERHISALTLLLTACNCQTLSDQGRMLERPKSRRVLERARDSSSSLIVYRDLASISSKSTDNLSKVSMMFGFDQELLSSKVYGRLLRGFHRQMLKQRHVHSGSGMLDQESASVMLRTPFSASKQEPWLRQSDVTNRFRSNATVLLLGNDEAGVGHVMKAATTIGNPLTTKELKDYRIMVYHSLINSARKLALNAEPCNPRLNVVLPALYHEDLDNVLLDWTNPMAEEFRDATQYLLDNTWPDQTMPGVRSSALVDSEQYFLDEIERILAPGYVPTLSDIRFAQAKLSSNCNSRILTGDFNISITHIYGGWPNVKQHIQNRSDVVSLIFVIDLMAYDRVIPGTQETELIATMEFFDTVVNSGKIRAKSFLLVFNNVSAFKKKLPTSSRLDIFQPYFPDLYPDSKDPVKIICDHFYARYQATASGYEYHLDPGDGNFSLFLIDCIDETLVKSVATWKNSRSRDKFLNSEVRRALTGQGPLAIIRES
ncbi:Guanine nucleotide-binding protein alpha-2 subunit [Kalmusia sp. IMI 367209]|nr:Guanine nucleotide-binding protein alpha-2 subunit [Kalmusia sp. IMI 367209]